MSRPARRPLAAGTPAVLLLLASLTASCSGCGGGAGEAPSEELVADYLAVAFGNRFGPPPAGLRKWPPSTATLVVRPTGDPTYEDRTHLRRLVRQLDAALEGLDLDLAEWDARPGNVEVRFLPLAGFAAAVPGYDGAYPAHFACRADPDGRLEGGLLLLPAGDEVPQYMRFNLLAEGLAACLGLAGAAEREAESVFYPRPNWYEEGFTRRDLEIVALHGRADLAPGLSRDEVARLLR